MRQHRTIYLNAIDQRRADRAAARNAGAITLYSTLAAILALSAPCAFLYAAMPPAPMPLPVRIGICVAALACLFALPYIGARIDRLRDPRRR